MNNSFIIYWATIYKEVNIISDYYWKKKIKNIEVSLQGKRMPFL